MAPETTEPAVPAGAHPRRASGIATTLLIAFLFPALLGAAAVAIGHRFARSAVVDIGPTDESYVKGFRDVERDGSTYFRWSSVPSSSLTFPIRFCGSGTLQARVRRHFVDPALLTVSIAGTIVGQRSVQAREDYPYDIITFQVPKILCKSFPQVLLESSVANDRPLGVAVDWIEIRAPGALMPTPATLARAATFVGLVGLGVLWCGGGNGILLAFVTGVALLLGFLFSEGPVAGERILRGGLAALTLTLGLATVIAMITGVSRLASRYRLVLLAVTVATLLSRAAFLDPQAFYPDYRVHALVQQSLTRSGLSSFLEHLFEIQYARSLGLQRIDGNWYPFPYPPGSYLLSAGMGAAFGLDPLDAAVATGVVASSLIPLLTAALGLEFGLDAWVSSGGACFVALQPLLVRRMALGYFPGLAGQLADAAALLSVLVSVRRGNGKLGRIALPVISLLISFLVYTQAIANFALLFAALLTAEWVRPSGVGRWAIARTTLAAAIALLVSLGIFYARYLPVLDNIAAHRPQPEARVLERLEEIRERAVEREPPEADDLNDPYAGATLNPIRGLERLGSRLWRFNGPFVGLLALGGWLLLKQANPSIRNVVVAMCTVPVGISVLAAGLPSPNGFQHLKDLEFVSPLLGLAMAVGLSRARLKSPLLSGVIAAAWIVFAGAAFWGEWSDRLLELAGR